MCLRLCLLLLLLALLLLLLLVLALVLLLLGTRLLALAGRRRGGPASLGLARVLGLVEGGRRPHP